MSGKSHYEVLGVGEDSSFDEIQEARTRLLKDKSGDRQQTEAVEAAYDAILMDRLRLRQEGKIKVPERIRFPERMVEPPPDFTPAPSSKSDNGIQRFIDRPNRSDILIPGALFLVMGAMALVIATPTIPLAVGVGFSLYFLNRKDHKFIRAFLLTIAGLVAGSFLGFQIGGLITSQLASIPLSIDVFVTGVTLFVLWLVSSFLR
ncbi:MAG: CPP1-like family protein [Oculatellaceae cyanobacterium Prado106]|jgi:hypothetical protein|nr:CPP1-like family protein [Oculatellaceae cyanobacterium Prado106]